MGTLVVPSLLLPSLLLPSFGMTSRGTGISFVPTAALDVSCEACLLIGPGGKVLFERPAGEPLPNASITKIVTALVVRARLAPDTEVVVSEHAASGGGGGLDLQPGDTFRTRDLLYAALMTSSNDSAVALAEAASGSEAASVSKMNALADELGATGGSALATSFPLGRSDRDRRRQDRDRSCRSLCGRRPVHLPARADRSDRGRDRGGAVRVQGRRRAHLRG